MKTWFLWTAATLVITLTTLDAAAVKYVSLNGNDGNNGNSWGQAYRSLQHAVNSAANGEEIWVQAGSYGENRGAAEGSLLINKNIRLYGGFNGTETALSQRNWVTNVTTINGFSSRSGSRAYTVVRVTASGATVDGFTITGGQANSSNQVYNERGGGVFVENNSFTLRNCIITENSATVAGNGMTIRNAFAPANEVIVEFCTFINNTSTTTAIDEGLGGGLNLQQTNARIHSNTFANNSARYGGGIYAVWTYPGTGTGITHNPPQIYNCVFYGNIARELGGGIHNHNAASDIRYCTFYNNNSQNGGEQSGVDGGAIGMTNSDCLPRCPSGAPATPGQPVVRNSVMVNNSGGATNQMFRATGSLNFSEPSNSNQKLGATVPNNYFQGHTANPPNFRPHPSNGALIDAAINATGDPTRDRDGTHRPMNGITGAQGGNRDKGAYEYDLTPPACNAVSGPVTLNLSDVDGNSFGIDEALSTLPMDAGGVKFVTVTGAFTASCATLGNNVVNVTVEDFAGNTSSCSTTFVVVDDVDPIITQCASDLQISADTNCEATVPDLTGSVNATDNCTANPTVTQSPLPGTTISLGITTVTLTVTDGAGNSTTCTADIEVVDDTPPTLSCPGPQTLSANGSCQALMPDLVAISSFGDNCPGLSVTQSIPAGTPIPLGLTTVTITADDGATTPVTCTVDVTVIDDTPPTLSCPGPQTLSADGSCQALMPDLVAISTTGDNCPGLSVTQSIPAGTPIPLGLTTVTITADDGATTPVSCTVDVTVVDDTPPTLTCPPTQILAIGANCDASMPDLVALATFIDNCPSLVVTQDIPAGTSIGSGTTTVTLTADDGVNAPVTCTVDVIVDDNEPPTAPVNGVDIQVDLSSSNPATYTLTTADIVAILDGNADDNCAVDFDATLATASVASFDCSDVDNLVPVTFTVTDTAGNLAANTTTANVLVEDNSSPTAVAVSGVVQVPLSNPTVNGVDLDDGSSDNCGIDSYLIDGAPSQTYDCADLGASFSVEFKVVDTAGNEATANVTIEVVDDIAPQALCVAGPIAVNLDENGIGTLSPSEVDNGSTDNCDSNPIISLDNTVFDCNDLFSPVTATLTVEDASGNSDSCQVIVNVQDVTAPVITRNGAGTIVVFEGDSYNDAGATVADNCDNSVTVVVGGDTVDTNTVGNYVITYNATDVSGNAATQVTRTVSVVSAGGPPIIVQSPANQSVNYASPATFSVLASGVGTLNYQWRKDSVPLSNGAKYSGVNTSTLLVQNAENGDEGNYDCIVSNNLGSATSGAATLTVQDPAITQHPANQTVGITQTATFNVTAVGSGTLGYQWFRAGSPATPLANLAGKIEGVNTASLSILDAQEPDEGAFFVEVTGADGSIQSNTVSLTVGDPVIVTDPASQLVAPGDTVQFSVVAQGTPPLVYQWRRNGVNVPNSGRFSGANTPTLTITGVQKSDEGLFTCVVVGQNIVSSGAATLTVGDVPVIDQLIVTPSSGAVPESGSASITVVMASGAQPFSYQWLKNGNAISDSGNVSGTNSAVLSIVNAQGADSGSYSVQVSNTFGTVVSQAVPISIGLFIISDLQDRIVQAGDNVSWSITVQGGLGSIEYQWYKNDANKAFVPLVNGPGISGVDTDTLVFTPVDYDDAGQYRVIVSDQFTSLPSRSATLQVVAQLNAAGSLMLAILSLLFSCAGVLVLTKRRRRMEHMSRHTNR